MFTSNANDLHHRFDTTGPITLQVEVRQGDIRLTATDSPATLVRLVSHDGGDDSLAEAFTVERRGDAVVVLGPKERDGRFWRGERGHVDVEVDLPAGSTVQAKTGSGDVTATGPLADVRAASGSGDLTLEDVGSAKLTSGSGDLTARSVRDTLDAKTGSGDIEVETVGADADLVSGSGDIRLLRAGGRVRAKSGSGDIAIGHSGAVVDLLTGTGDLTLGAVNGGAVRAKTGTGDVSIAVATGVAAYLDLNTVTGEVTIDLDDADGPEGSEAQARLTVHSGSGDVRVTRAQAALP